MASQLQVTCLLVLAIVAVSATNIETTPKQKDRDSQNAPAKVRGKIDFGARVQTAVRGKSYKENNEQRSKEEKLKQHQEQQQQKKEPKPRELEPIIGPPYTVVIRGGKEISTKDDKSSAKSKSNHTDKVFTAEKRMDTNIEDGEIIYRSPNTVMSISKSYPDDAYSPGSSQDTKITIRTAVYEDGIDSQHSPMVVMTIVPISPVYAQVDADSENNSSLVLDSHKAPTNLISTFRGTSSRNSHQPTTTVSIKPLHEKSSTIRLGKKTDLHKHSRHSYVAPKQRTVIHGAAPSDRLTAKQQSSIGHSHDHLPHKHTQKHFVATYKPKPSDLHNNPVSTKQSFTQRLGGRNQNIKFRLTTSVADGLAHSKETPSNPVQQTQHQTSETTNHPKIYRHAQRLSNLGGHSTRSEPLYHFNSYSHEPFQHAGITHLTTRQPLIYHSASSPQQIVSPQPMVATTIHQPSVIHHQLPITHHTTLMHQLALNPFMTQVLHTTPILTNPQSSVYQQSSSNHVPTVGITTANGNQLWVPSGPLSVSSGGFAVSNDSYASYDALTGLQSIQQNSMQAAQESSHQPQFVSQDSEVVQQNVPVFQLVPSYLEGNNEQTTPSPNAKAALAVTQSVISRRVIDNVDSGENISKEDSLEKNVESENVSFEFKKIESNTTVIPENSTDKNDTEGIETTTEITTETSLDFTNATTDSSLENIQVNASESLNKTKESPAVMALFHSTENATEFNVSLLDLALNALPLSEPLIQLPPPASATPVTISIPDPIILNNEGVVSTHHPASDVGEVPKTLPATQQLPLSLQLPLSQNIPFPSSQISSYPAFQASINPHTKQLWLTQHIPISHAFPIVQDLANAQKQGLNQRTPTRVIIPPHHLRSTRGYHPLPRMKHIHGTRRIPYAASAPYSPFFVLHGHDDPQMSESNTVLNYHVPELSAIDATSYEDVNLYDPVVALERKGDLDTYDVEYDYTPEDSQFDLESEFSDEKKEPEEDESSDEATFPAEHKENTTETTTPTIPKMYEVTEAAHSGPPPTHAPFKKFAAFEKRSSTPVRGKFRALAHRMGKPMSFNLGDLRKPEENKPTLHKRHLLSTDVPEYRFERSLFKHVDGNEPDNIILERSTPSEFNKIETKSEENSLDSESTSKESDSSLKSTSANRPPLILVVEDNGKFELNPGELESNSSETSTEEMSTESGIESQTVSASRDESSTEDSNTGMEDLSTERIEASTPTLQESNLQDTTDFQQTSKTQSESDEKPVFQKLLDDEEQEEEQLSPDDTSISDSDDNVMSFKLKNSQPPTTYAPPLVLIPSQYRTGNNGPRVRNRQSKIGKYFGTQRGSYRFKTAGFERPTFMTASTAKPAEASLDYGRDLGYSGQKLSSKLLVSDDTVETTTFNNEISIAPSKVTEGTVDANKTESQSQDNSYSPLLDVLSDYLFSSDNATSTTGDPPEYGLKKKEGFEINRNVTAKPQVVFFTPVNTRTPKRLESKPFYNDLNAEESAPKEYESREPYIKFEPLDENKDPRQSQVDENADSTTYPKDSVSRTNQHQGDYRETWSTDPAEERQESEETSFSKVFYDVLEKIVRPEENENKGADEWAYSSGSSPYVPIDRKDENVEDLERIDNVSVPSVVSKDGSQGTQGTGRMYTVSEDEPEEDVNPRAEKLVTSNTQNAVHNLTSASADKSGFFPASPPLSTSGWIPTNPLVQPNQHTLVYKLPTTQQTSAHHQNTSNQAAEEQVVQFVTKNTESFFGSTSKPLNVISPKRPLEIKVTTYSPPININYVATQKVDASTAPPTQQPAQNIYHPSSTVASPISYQNVQRVVPDQQDSGSVRQPVFHSVAPSGLKYIPYRGKAIAGLQSGKVFPHQIPHRSPSTASSLFRPVFSRLPFQLPSYSPQKPRLSLQHSIGLHHTPHSPFSVSSPLTFSRYNPFSSLQLNTGFQRPVVSASPHNSYSFFQNGLYGSTGLLGNSLRGSRFKGLSAYSLLPPQLQPPPSPLMQLANRENRGPHTFPPNIEDLLEDPTTPRPPPLFDRTTTPASLFYHFPFIARDGIDHSASSKNPKKVLLPLNTFKNPAVPDIYRKKDYTLPETQTQNSVLGFLRNAFRPQSFWDLLHSFYPSHR